MRTTISIDDELLRAAKEAARRSGLSLGQYIERALRRESASRPGPTEGPPIPVFRDGKGVRPGIDVSSTRALLEALDEDEPLERLR